MQDHESTDTCACALGFSIHRLTYSVLRVFSYGAASSIESLSVKKAWMCTWHGNVRFHYNFNSRSRLNVDFNLARVEPKSRVRRMKSSTFIPVKIDWLGRLLKWVLNFSRGLSIVSNTFKQNINQGYDSFYVLITGPLSFDRSSRCNRSTEESLTLMTQKWNIISFGRPEV